jgi:phosphoribosyl 1,2-cyclic phosphodiesterase
LIYKNKVNVGWGEKRTPTIKSNQIVGVHKFTPTYELNKIPNARKILIHINNSNPILDEDSPEYKQLGDVGIEVAYDGMEIEL